MSMIKGIIYINLVIFVIPQGLRSIAKSVYTMPFIIATWKWRILYFTPNLFSHFPHAEFVKDTELTGTFQGIPWIQMIYTTCKLPSSLNVGCYLISPLWCTTSICLTRVPFLIKDLSHNVQEKGVNLWWTVSICLVRFSDWANDLSHNVQECAQQQYGQIAAVFLVNNLLHNLQEI